MTPLGLWTLTAALALASVHLGASALRWAPEPPRSLWLSAAGGLSVAYVFVHVLPELHAGQLAVESAFATPGVWIEHHVYLVSLGGLVVFYGLERLARASRAAQRERQDADRTSGAVFWIHIASFSLYNLLIGYLLTHREERTPAPLALFTIAMALHFLVTDHALREHHKDAYLHHGRWIVSASILVGYAAGVATRVSIAAVSTLFAFLAGGVILNVLKEELPEERESRFWAFLAGAAGYAVLLVAL